MKTIVLTFIFVISIHGFMKGQNSDGGFNIGAEIVLPVGDWSSSVNLGIGATARYVYPISEEVGISATAGYLYFLTESDDFEISMIPIQSGVRYKFSENFYGLGEIGVHIVNAKQNGSSGFGGSGSSSDTETKLSFAPGVGYTFDSGIDLGLRFQLIEDANYLALRASYNF